VVTSSFGWVILESEIAHQTEMPQSTAFQRKVEEGSLSAITGLAVGDGVRWFSGLVLTGSTGAMNWSSRIAARLDTVGWGGVVPVLPSEHAMWETR